MWSQHGGDEILWTVSGVGSGTGDAVVLGDLRVCVESIVGTDEVRCWWVEDYLSKYVVVGGIPEINWAASGWEGVQRDNPGVAWGHRGPCVFSKVWGNLAMKLEGLSAAAVCAVVKSGVVVGVKRYGAQLAIAAGSRGVPRGPAPAKGGAPVRGSAVGGVKCYGCGKVRHLRRDCRDGGGSGPIGCPPFRCWGCGGVGHGISYSPGRALPVMNAAGVPVPAAGARAAAGGAKRGEVTSPARVSVLGRLLAGAWPVTLWVVLAGLLLPLRVREPNVRAC